MSIVERIYNALWIYATNLGVASRATPDTCAQACESAAGSACWRVRGGVATHCASAQCLLRLPTRLLVSRVHVHCSAASLLPRLFHLTVFFWTMLHWFDILLLSKPLFWRYYGILICNFMHRWLQRFLQYQPLFCQGCFYNLRINNKHNIGRHLLLSIPDE